MASLLRCNLLSFIYRAKEQHMPPMVPPFKPLPANVRKAMAQGIPLHQAVAGETKATGPKIKVGGK